MPFGMERQARTLWREALLCTWHFAALPFSSVSPCVGRHTNWSNIFNMI